MVRRWGAPEKQRPGMVPGLYTAPGDNMDTKSTGAMPSETTTPAPDGCGAWNEAAFLDAIEEGGETAVLALADVLGRIVGVCHRRACALELFGPSQDDARTIREGCEHLHAVLVAMKADAARIGGGRV